MAEEQENQEEQKPDNKNWADMIEINENISANPDDTADSAGSRILNQEEIDSLLGYSSGEDE